MCGAYFQKKFFLNNVSLIHMPWTWYNLDVGLHAVKAQLSNVRGSGILLVDVSSVEVFLKSQLRQKKVVVLPLFTLY